MKKTIILVFICSLPLLSNAQVSSYIIGGTSNRIMQNEDSRFGYNLGLLFDFPFSKFLSFQTGLNYNYVASSYNNLATEYINGVKTTFDNGVISTDNFLEIPACISFRYKLSEKTNWHFNTGPYVDIFTGGSNLFLTSTSEYAMYQSYTYPEVNLGFLLGSGIEFRKFYLGIEGNIIVTGFTEDITFKTKLGIRF